MYIQLNSQVICYEKTGEGSPVILIHGNCEDHHIFDELVEVMSETHTVYAMDTRGHGESATPKEYHYEDMASDVINLINALEIEKPYLVGYSDGGIIALMVAMRESKLLSGIVCCGANLSPSGFHLRAIHEIKKSFKKNNDPRVKLMLLEPDIKERDLSAISVPALIMAGSNDCIKERETKRIVESIADAKLEIVANATHSDYVVHNAQLYDRIKMFID
ncbi:Pimeloyl-ACP methyl ester carboxylesterase [Pseudobutyrivibrio sp. YE44]|uniref:alpha/beta fold hydrolase n=1 Tax=Pseudobutyrivibrio sp. YE44 TaxID=1520802 RepID=UPI00088486E2|nr:alpha/beta hydrolase [Pseudobutyrivibrio sp. YE44]SDB25572.1 Pimeloyl-ACP methyl ester carboxylesterase [Pseudobutyrivibrio sp. YE44]